MDRMKFETFFPLASPYLLTYKYHPSIVATEIESDELYFQFTLSCIHIIIDSREFCKMCNHEICMKNVISLEQNDIPVKY